LTIEDIEAKVLRISPNNCEFVNATAACETNFAMMTYGSRIEGYTSIYVNRETNFAMLTSSLWVNAM